MSDAPNFDELRRLLRDNADALARAGTPDADQLAARTRQLAQAVELPVEVGRRVLTFRLDAEMYGWPVENVRAINRISFLTPVPSAPAYYRGVTSLRGQVLSVMDLRIYLGQTTAAPRVDSGPKLLIVIGGAGLEIGVLADDVFEVITLPPDALTNHAADLILGVTAKGLSVVNAEALLTREWQRVHGTT